MFHQQYDYALVESVHQFPLFNKEHTFLVVRKAKRNIYERTYKLHPLEKWDEVFAFPISWLDSVVGMIFKDNAIFPVDNTSNDRNALTL